MVLAHKFDKVDSPSTTSITTTGAGGELFFPLETPWSRRIRATILKLLHYPLLQKGILKITWFTPKDYVLKRGLTRWSRLMPTHNANISLNLLTFATTYLTLRRPRRPENSKDIHEVLVFIAVQSITWIRTMEKYRAVGQERQAHEHDLQLLQDCAVQWALQ